MNNKVLAAIFFAFVSTAALADDYGCKVLLCLGDPQGPMTQTDCKPPIRRFFEEQARKNPPSFPTCEESKGTLTGKIGMNYFDACPEGTTALAAGAEAMLAEQKTVTTPMGPMGQVVEQVVVYTGTGDGSQGIMGAGTVTCVGKPMGKVTFTEVSGTGDSQSVNTRTVDAYDSVTSQPMASGSPRYVDVLVNGSVYKRVRF